MALTFKDQLREDVKSTFFNREEFSDEHTVDGKKMDAIIDNNELIERQKSSAYASGPAGIAGAPGLFNRQMLVMVPAEQYGPRPKPGKPFVLDGAMYTVQNAIEEDGVYSITLIARGN